jgi:hypothetical protein
MEFPKEKESRNRERVISLSVGKKSPQRAEKDLGIIVIPVPVFQALNHELFIKEPNGEDHRSRGWPSLEAFGMSRVSTQVTRSP